MSSILAAFERQRNGKLCVLCGNRVPISTYQSHMDLQCSSVNNDDCMILESKEQCDNNYKINKTKRKRTDENDTNSSTEKPIESTSSAPSLSHEETSALSNEDTEFQPYYLRIFREIVNSVWSFYGKEDGLWTKEQSGFVLTFLDLTDCLQMIYIRLFLRKLKWIPVTKMNYSEFGDSFTSELEKLTQIGLLESISSSCLSLFELVDLLQLPALRSIAKHFKLNWNISKENIKEALINHSKQKSLFGQTLENNIIKRCKSELGPCYHLTSNCRNVFVSIFNLYSPLHMMSSLLLDNPNINLAQSLLFTLRQVETGQLIFPVTLNDFYERRPSIYRNGCELFSYVEAQEMETKIAKFIFSSQWENIIEIGQKAKEKLEKISNETATFASNIPEYLRRYTWPWVLTRICWHTVEALQRLKRFEEAVDLLFWLLREGGEIWCMDNRGTYWNRLTLNLHIHLKTKQKALEMLSDAFDDNLVRMKDRLPLFDRLNRLINSKSNKNQSMSFPEPPELHQIPEVTVCGILLDKNLGDGSKNVFLSSNDRTSVCSVETVALQYYIKDKGYNQGIHGEGVPWHSLFGLLFWSVIFDPSIDYVWLSSIQSEPIDLNFKHFYEARKENFESRFSWLNDSNEKEIMNEIEISWKENHGKSCYFVSWDHFEDSTQLQRLAACIGGRKLSQIFRHLAIDFRHKRSGFPDLTVWNFDKRIVKSKVLVIVYLPNKNSGYISFYLSALTQKCVMLPVMPKNDSN